MTDLPPPWAELLLEPPDLDPARPGAWFEAVAGRLLRGCRLRAGGRLYRPAEVEFYYHTANHPDPFSHRQAVQRSAGRWYFHRSGGSYRGGSFKGLDLTFGGESAFGGILLRSLAADDGALIDGPSRLVDHLLGQTERAGVAALDAALQGLPAWTPGLPLELRWIEPQEPRPIHATARVGLSLKRSSLGADAPTFLLRPYRFLTEPRRITRGQLQLVLALHARGLPPAEIQDLTGCPRQTIARYLADFERGRQESTLAPYLGTELSPQTLARLHGLWEVRYGG